ncbi:MAG: DUF4442 domain-containing protein [Acidobacteria bacterium]|nr:DUF4442 domain-containing protein [Acidobacteriota bacterium]
MNTRQRWLLRFVSLWPPFLGAGIRVRVLAEDPLEFESRLRLAWSNRNWVGTHYGGSLYSMCDPFYMILLAEALGPGFVVWDKSATIRYLRPGRGTVRARFAIPEQRIEEIRAEAESVGRATPRFECVVLDGSDERIAVVEKVISVRLAGAPEPI